MKIFLVRRTKYKEGILNETTTITTFPSVFFPSLRTDPIHHLCVGQSLTVWARKWDLQMVSYTDDEAHTAAPAAN